MIVVGGTGVVLPVFGVNSGAAIVIVAFFMSALLIRPDVR
jgi:hypothetical protein